MFTGRKDQDLTRHSIVLYRAAMAWTISELRQRGVALGLTLPPFIEAAATTAGTPVWTAEVAGADGFRTWCGLRELHAESGWWPFLGGDRSDRRTPWDGFGPRPDPKALASGRRVDAQRLLALQFAGRNRGVSGLDIFAVEGDFTREARDLGARLTGTVDPAHDGHAFVPAVHAERSTLCLIQAHHGYEVPALLAWEGARDVGLGGAEHYAVLRHFARRYGAELVGLTPTAMDLLITQRPRAVADVATAALELYAYCPRVVLDRAGGLEELVDEQLLNGTWTLWWAPRTPLDARP